MIHKAVMDYVKTRLERDLIDRIAEQSKTSSDGNIGSAGTDDNDDTIPGAIKLGPLQGDPDPDVARISVEIYENDPDQEIKGSGISSGDKLWKDEIEEIEIGGCITWKRRFTVKVRVLLEATREDLENARRVASTVRSRVEKSFMSMRFANVSSDGETVVMGPFSDDLISEMLQAGGPPDAYDFFIKVKFEVLTTQLIVEE
jgi:hypothetical protein